MASCVVTGASSATLVGSSAASLVARDCVFGNTRAAIASERGGSLNVRRCRFELASSQDLGFRLAADTRGYVGEHLGVTGGGSLWGRVLPPKEVVFEEEPPEAGGA